MDLELDKGQFERGRSLEDSGSSLERLLQETVSTGRVAGLTLDPDYLVFEPQQVTSNIITDEVRDGNSIFLSETKLWIVIGSIIALVIVAVIQAGCTIYRTMRHPTPNHKDILIQNSAWKDYSAANTNYAFDAFEHEEKQPSSMAHTNGSSRSTMPLTSTSSKPMPMQHAPPSHHPHHPHQYQSNGGGGGGGHYADSRSLQRPRGGGGGNYHPSGGPPEDRERERGDRGHRERGGDRETERERRERSTYSLPRQPPPPQHHNGFYTHRPPRPHNDQLQPDFYFMPSQRKYSGEVVRVYVDYNTPRK